jgi:F-type H+-transporting ATPase subunit epsilon
MSENVPNRMRLKIVLPTQVLLEEGDLIKISAEGQDRAFTLLPRHIDFTTVLVPGILTYVKSDGIPHYAALDEGVLVKRRWEVFVSVMNGILTDDLESIGDVIKSEFGIIDEQEERMRTAMQRLETDLVQQFIDLSEE